MFVPIEEVQAALSKMPHHIVHVDLLVFRNVEMESPTPWMELARWAGVLLEAIRALRSDRLDSVTGSWSRVAHALCGDPPLVPLCEMRLDTLTEEMLIEINSWAATQNADRPRSRDPAREQLAALTEERLQDVLLETAYGIRRQRRAPRLPPEKNPLLPQLPLSRRALLHPTAELFESLVRQMGPVPESMVVDRQSE